MDALTYQQIILYLASGLVVTFSVVMFALIVCRKLIVQRRGRLEDRLAAKIHKTLLQWLDGGAPEHAPEKHMRPFNRDHIVALKQAVRRLEAAGRADVRARLRASDLPGHLVRALDPVNDRWTRATAARAVAFLGVENALPPLVALLDEKDSDVAYAAAGAVAEVGTPEAAEALLDRVESKPRLNNARLVTYVEAMTCELEPVVVKMLRRDDPVAIFWALGLIGEKRFSSVIETIRPFLAHADANVRAAAAECVGLLQISGTDLWLEPLLDDGAWFVRCHAAKALGVMNAAWAAERIAAMLSDREWWCRHNAVEALVSLGKGAYPALEALLANSEDRFARNSAVEALERSGWFETAFARAARGDIGSREALRVATKCGGIGYIENALTSAPEAVLGLVLDLLEEMGDRISWGRIRRAVNLKLLPEAFVPRANAVAASLVKP